jgi:clan AA aspartic protease
MIGQVTDAHEAVINLTIIGPHNDQLQIEAVLDSGFTDYLTLTTTTIAQLQLQFLDTTECQLADGRIVSMQSFQATVEWHGTRRDILVLAADGQPLLGMSLLLGSRVTMDVVIGGELRIEPIT